MIDIPIGHNSLTTSLHVDQRFHRASNFSSALRTNELRRLLELANLIENQPLRERIIKALARETLFGSSIQVTNWENRTGRKLDQRYIVNRRSGKPKGPLKTAVASRRRKSQEKSFDPEDYL